MNTDKGPEEGQWSRNIDEVRRREPEEEEGAELEEVKGGAGNSMGLTGH